VHVATAHFHALLAADVSLVDLDNAALPAERRQLPSAHRFTNAVRQKPRRLVGDFENAVELMGRDTLLAAGHQIDGLEHLVQRHAGMLEHGADLDGELAFAMAAAPQAKPNALDRVGSDPGDPIQCATMRANRSVRPKDTLKIGKSLFFVMEVGAGQNGHCGNSL
jgi:hypothetical protein